MRLESSLHLAQHRITTISPPSPRDASGQLSLLCAWVSIQHLPGHGAQPPAMSTSVHFQGPGFREPAGSVSSRYHWKVGTGTDTGLKLAAQLSLPPFACISTQRGETLFLRVLRRWKQLFLPPGMGVCSARHSPLLPEFLLKPCHNWQKACQAPSELPGSEFPPFHCCFLKLQKDLGDGRAGGIT